MNHLDWKLKGFWPYVPFKERSMEVGNELMGVTDWLPAQVPGGVHHDLMKAGLIPDPYYELNSLACEWVENRWWMYKTNVVLDDRYLDKHLQLVFKGVDYVAHFFLNGQKLGVHEGMFHPAVFNVTGLMKKGNNELIVLLEHAPDEMHQIGHTSMTKTQKSRFNYKWDFGTRLVNLGIWQDVILKVSEGYVIEETRISTDVVEGKGIIHSSFRIKGIPNTSCKALVRLEFDGECISEERAVIHFDSDYSSFVWNYTIPNPELWYPHDVGDQPLYTLTVDLYNEEKLSDRLERRVGIRKLEYRLNENSPAGALPYTIVINDKPIYIKGVNITPFDHLYGNLSYSDYARYVQLIKEANINLVRVWGGGIIEKECFYELCDEHGIMIWQEFIQSSSGVDNIPSKDPHFLQLLSKTVRAAVMERRNHVSHVIWSGGNELADENFAPVDYTDENIQMIKQLVEKLDPGKLFLPSSASGPLEFLDVSRPRQNHDVHGKWKYEGVTRHYQVYNQSDSLLHSEFGVDGLSHLESLKNFLHPDNLKVTNMAENLTWRHHGEWWDTFFRDTEIFGKMSDIQQFIHCSQFIQAEGLRYILESNRRRKFQNSGSIIWQLNEPWPNVSCTSLVDYYKRPKMAYYWVRKAFAPIHVSLKHEGLMHELGIPFRGEIYLHSTAAAAQFKVGWEVLDISGRVIAEGHEVVYASERTAVLVKNLDLPLPEFPSKVFFVRLKVSQGEEEMGSNLYVFSQRTEEIFRPLLELNGAQLEIVQDGNRHIITNTGSEVALFVQGWTVSHPDLIVDGNYSSLFPGERRLFKVSDPSLEIKWTYFNQ